MNNTINIQLAKLLCFASLAVAATGCIESGEDFSPGNESFEDNAEALATNQPAERGEMFVGDVTSPGGTIGVDANERDDSDDEIFSSWVCQDDSGQIVDQGTCWTTACEANSLRECLRSGADQKYTLFGSDPATGIGENKENELYAQTNYACYKDNELVGEGTCNDGGPNCSHAPRAYCPSYDRVEYSY